MRIVVAASYENMCERTWAAKVVFAMHWRVQATSEFEVGDEEKEWVRVRQGSHESVRDTGEMLV